MFQPAEEGVCGGPPVAESGILDDADELLCFHIGDESKLGQFAVAEKGFLATTKLNVASTGLPSHAGSRPEKGKSALLAACNAATLMPGISRHSEGITRICIGRLSAGKGRNIAPVHALIELETRGETAEVDRFLVEEVTHIARGAALSYGLDVEVTKVGSATTLKADPEMSAFLMKEAQSIEGIKEVGRCDDVTASEDCT